ncbi:NAD(P)H-dependent oxidoreductase subunit E [Uliginosibacterium sediminicola]
MVGINFGTGLMDSYFKHHVFFCCNQRPAPDQSCAALGANELQAYAKQRINALGLNGKGSIRINKAGCLGRCDEGPVLVVYPEGVWYRFVDESDIDEIISEHLQNGRPVERLKL